MNKEIIPSKVNSVTEHKDNYKLISLSLMDSYNGLHPSSISKLSHVIFNLIIYNKIYRKPDNKNYSLEEDKRIYSNVLITPESILKRIAPSKYTINNKTIINDISNLTSRMQILEDNNIFYIWRYKQPCTYIFIMERDVGCWKYYNSSAFVTPKTLKKIVRAGKCIIDTMVKLEEKRDRISNIQDIEKSFGYFLNRIIDKMNPSVSSDLSKWVDTANIGSYLIRLSSDLRNIEDFKGQVFSSDFLKHLPESVSKEILNNKVKREKTKENNMNINELESELVPENGNLIKIRKHRKTKVSSEESPVAISSKFVSVDPFCGPHEFVKFYRSVIRSKNPEVKFYNATLEYIDAEQILDTLTKNGKSGDIKFLKMWIYNYVSTSLKDNIHKIEKTSLESFMKTFSSFNNSYYG